MWICICICILFWRYTCVCICMTMMAAGACMVALDLYLDVNLWGVFVFALVDLDWGNTEIYRWNTRPTFLSHLICFAFVIIVAFVLEFVFVTDNHDNDGVSSFGLSADSKNCWSYRWCRLTSKPEVVPHICETKSTFLAQNLSTKIYNLSTDIYNFYTKIYNLSTIIYYLSTDIYAISSLKYTIISPQKLFFLTYQFFNHSSVFFFTNIRYAWAGPIVCTHNTLLFSTMFC